MKKNSLLFLLISIFGFAQNTSKNLLEGLWRIDEVMGVSPTSEYNLSKPEKKEIRDSFIPQDTKNEIPDKYIYGTSVIFNSNGTFESQYSYWCGNDCFRSSNGTFELIDNTHIHLKVDSVYFSGYCQRSNIGYQDLGVFLIKKQENGYKLIKCSEKETDVQCEKYSEIVNNLPNINSSNPEYIKILLYINDIQKKNDSEILKSGLKKVSNFITDEIQLVYTTYPRNHGLEKRFVFKYNNKLFSAIYYPNSAQLILYNKPI